MKKLEMSDRDNVEKFLQTVEQKTFYHYFPLLLAISETDGPFFMKDGVPRISENVLCYGEESKDEKFWVSCIRKKDSELYDVNYVYDLETTVNIKNFKANVKKFKKRNKNYSRSGLYGSDLAVEVLKDWYSKRKGNFTDFGYTLWLAKNRVDFLDLYSDVVLLDGKPVAFSVWGALDNETAIHIISKDKGIPYLQDWLRMELYNEMIENGFKYVNDGGDCGIHELRQYKLKLRPKFIIPIWSGIK